MLVLIISYDNNGRMVGFDATLPVFTSVLPYEGCLNWSLKSDEYGQVIETTHGELQVYDENRIKGNARIIKGRDVDGVCESGLEATIEVSNSQSGESFGIGTAGSLIAVMSHTDEGMDIETLTGDSRVFVLDNQTDETILTADLTGKSETSDGTSASIDATMSFSFPNRLDTDMRITIATAPAEEMTIHGGQAVLITELDEASISALVDMAKGKMKAMVPRLMLHPSLLTDIANLIAP